MSKLFLPISLAVALSACSGDYSENYQAATARTASDIGLTVLAEEKPLSYEDVVVIGSIARDLDNFLGTGDVSGLTSSQLKSILEARIPVQYAPYFSAAIAYLSTQTVDTGVIPDKVVRLVRNALRGIESASDNWVPEETK